MPDIQVTDQLDKPVESVTIDPAHPSSLIKYAQTEVLHLAVFPDFLERKDLLLSQAATKPIQFKAKAANKFQIGNSKPELCITPDLQAVIDVNATPGKENTGYVALDFEGKLDYGVSGSDGDLTFGLEASSTAKLQYSKAFPLGSGELTLGAAFGQTLSSFVIPANLADVQSLSVNDSATVSGEGSLKVSSSVTVTVIPNPLASVDLPLSELPMGNLASGFSKLSATGGPAFKVSADFIIRGSYEVKARRKDANTIELSFSPGHGTTLEADFSASAGIAAKVGGDDLIAAVIGAISTDPPKDTKELDSLSPSERDALADGIKRGLDRNLQACVSEVLSASTDDKATFHYEIQPAKLSVDASVAIQHALRGDLRQLTAMEANMQHGVLAPGVTLLQSVLSETCKRNVAFKLNLLGMLNYVSVSDLIRNSEVLTDDITGDVTIKETVTGNRISALTNLLDRHNALRKAMFDSVVATTCYRASKAVSMPGLNCEQVHFAVANNTTRQTMGNYLNWFVALNLLSAPDKQTSLTSFAGDGQSTCVLRTSFADNDCTAMFFDQNGNLHETPFYVEIGRQALMALVDAQDNPNNQLRKQILSDALWPQALQIGASNELASLVGLSPSDARVVYLTGDVDVITSWAQAMSEAGTLIQQVRTFVGDADPATLLKNAEFNNKRAALQKKLSAMVRASKVRFDQPWGMVCLYQSAGAPPSAYGKLTAGKFTLVRGTQRTLAAGATS